MSYAYTGFGLEIQTDIEMPILPIGSKPKPDLTIKKGPTPTTLSSGTAIGLHWEVSDTEFLLTIEGTCRIYGKSGSIMTVEIVKGRSVSQVLPYILGSGIGGILHQRRSVALHGSALSIDGRSIVICGKSGSGKSTTAALLIARHGMKLMSDDIVAIGEADDTLVANPAYPQSKLSETALRSVGADPALLERTTDERRKYLRHMHADFDPLPRPVSAIFALRIDDVPGPRITRIRPKMALPLLHVETFRKRFVNPANMHHILHKNARIAQYVPVFKVTRPSHRDTSEEVAEAVYSLLMNMEKG